jgi:hypothetical protein
MALDPNEIGYFIQNVGLAALSFGVTQDDVNTVGSVLMQYFGYRCSPPLDIVGWGPELQSICADKMCPKDPNSVCKLYPWYGVSPEPQSAPGCSSGAYSSGGGYHR